MSLMGASVNYAVGSAVETSGKVFLTTDSSIEGFVLFGPYSELEAGRYAVDFEIGTADGWVPDFDSVCGFVDVASNHGTAVHAHLPFYASQISHGLQRFTLAFELRERSTVEFRVCNYRVAPLVIAYERPVRAISSGQGQYSPTFPLERSTVPQFVAERMGELQASHKNGVTFSIEGDKCIASVSGVSIEVENPEDFQLLEEIFNMNDYNFSAEGKFVAFDIGMNVGLASLFMAGMPNVEKIYSFEPFPEPFARAQRNFTRNRDRAVKILPQMIGLSDVDETVSVGISVDKTISTSVKGVEGGQLQSIELKHAANTLKPLFEEAVRAGQKIAMKIDCEGSEFAIINSLSHFDMLRHVAVVMIEWHKWWSTSLNRSALIDPLKRAGFVVLDRTAVTNPHAGMILAVRSA